jgi:hypothetical protein
MSGLKDAQRDGLTRVLDAVQECEGRQRHGGNQRGTQTQNNHCSFLPASRVFLPLA